MINMMIVMITDNNDYDNNNNNKCDKRWLKILMATYKNSTNIRIRQQQFKTRQKSWQTKKQRVSIHVVKIRSYIKKARKNRTCL
jgi:hypothetical protein